jgi:putative redox protein
LVEDGVFLARSKDGRLLIIDARGSEERSGFSPMELLLLAAAGCTAIDIDSSLKKMRQDFRGLEVEICGERREEYPRIYRRVELVYRVKGEVDLERVRRAVELSLERYCSASITLKRAGAELSYNIEIEVSS